MIPAVPTTNGTIGPGILNSVTLSHLFSNGSAQQLLQTLPQMLNNPHTTNSPLINPLNPTVPSLLTTPPSLHSTPSAQSTPNQQRSPHNLSQMNPAHYPESKLHQQSLNRNDPSPNPSNGSINRLTTSNGELTITTSLGPNSSQNLKRSPSSLSPNCNENSTADLLVDSPSKYIIAFTIPFFEFNKEELR